MSFGPVYLVTDTQAPISIRDQVNQAAAGGAGLIQYRDKHCTDLEFFEVAQQLVRDLRGYSATLILNDRIKVAREIESVGVHVGQSDGALDWVRHQIGSDRLLGISIESPAQMALLPENQVDYIGAGPVKLTLTKPDHAPPIGLEGLQEIVKRASVPVYAIGGLTLEDVVQVRESGAAGLAVVSAITRSNNPRQATQALIQEWSNHDS